MNRLVKCLLARDLLNWVILRVRDTIQKFSNSMEKLINSQVSCRTKTFVEASSYATSHLVVHSRTCIHYITNKLAKFTMK